MKADFLSPETRAKYALVILRDSHGMPADTYDFIERFLSACEDARTGGYEMADYLFRNFIDKNPEALKAHYSAYCTAWRKYKAGNNAVLIPHVYLGIVLDYLEGKLDCNQAFHAIFDFAAEIS